MIVYSVQTNDSTRNKTFISGYKATQYYNRLIAELDRESVQTAMIRVSDAEFNLLNFDD